MADIEQTRAVVTEGETFDGKIIPTEQAELDRPVRVRDRATVQGSIFGDAVETHADSTVEGSVMASSAVEMEGGHIQGEVGTPGKVVGSDGRIEGTVTGKRVRLTNTLVRGNVVGSDVILEDSVVLGIVTAERSLTIEDSLCYTFRSEGETSLEQTTTILPQAICNGPIDLENPVSVAGLGELDIDADGTESDDTDLEKLPKMTAEDLYEHGETTYLTLAPRILNLEKITDRLADLEDGIMAAVEDTSGDDAASTSVEDVLTLLGVKQEMAT